MVAETSSPGRRLFPEIRISFRAASRSSQIALSPALQIAAASAIVAAAVALAYLGISRLNHSRFVADQQAKVVRAEAANADLREEVAKVGDRLAAAFHDREQAEARSSALAAQADTLRGMLATAAAKPRSLDEQLSRPLEQGHQMQQPPATAEPADAPQPDQIERLTRALDQARRVLQQVEAQRATLAARLGKIETNRTEPQLSYSQYNAVLEAAARKMRQLSADRDRAIGERDRLRARIGDPDQKHSLREVPQPRGLSGFLRLATVITPGVDQLETDTFRPEEVITDAPPEPKERAGGVAEIGRRAISEVERVLVSTGLDVQRLFSQFHVNRSEGGPFVPPPKADQPRETDHDALEGWRGLIKSLPLSLPLDHYQLESGFGPRRDPFNRRLSFHTGLDLSASYMSPVYTTAPGIVIYAGYFGDYGKVVEIDHGNGLVTLYGHMHRYTVSVGQRVAAHTQIGFLGSTGRSSGPHVHYEIRVNDEPQDPAKFIGLAHLIPISER
jgi:murein DD-endopeptidase MepM/ murein hydrolase activator NlpD